MLVLEFAPEEESGGNTRVSGQLMFIPDTPEDAIKYQVNLNGPYAVDEALLAAWAENLCENLEWFDNLGADLQEATSCNPEFPDIEGSEGCRTYLHEGVTGKQHLWEFLTEVASDYELPDRVTTPVRSSSFATPQPVRWPACSPPTAAPSRQRRA